VKGWLPVAVLLLAACGGTAADHERLGDTAYGQGEYTTALAEYRAAARTAREGRAWAKLGAAALKSGEFREAAAAYLRLAELDKTRATEAARGLEQVARAADGAGMIPALKDAVTGLRLLAPERVNPRHTISLARSGQLEEAAMVAMGPLALAAAGDAASVDQMLLQYGGALERTTACGDAVELYEVVLRRSRDPATRQRATDGLGDCGLVLGREALSLKRADVAAAWYARVTGVDSTSDRGRLALIGLGDARVAMGDLLGATLVYQDALRGSPSDSVFALATARLAQLGGAAVNADST
jgi:tetratricopeptide (TPR) repeat protein